MCWRGWLIVDMPAKERPLKLDLAAIDFPSDKVTLGEMRRLEPSMFVPGKFFQWHLDDVGIISTLDVEMVLAETAFAKRAKLPNPHPEVARSEAIAWLNDGYKECGLSSGLQQTKLLVREIESAAIRQAEQMLSGQSR